jgi:hypothetical protein
MMPEKESKKLSYDEFRNIFIEHATTYWMGINGLDMSDPKTSQYELDESNPDSQFSAWRDTASEAFDLFIEALARIENSGYEVDFSVEETDDVMSVVADYVQDNLGNGSREPEEPKPVNAVTKSSTVFVFMQTSPGVPTYVSDVREWLAEIDSLGVPDSTEIEGELFLSFDNKIVTGERLECLTCGDKEDVLMVMHNCPGESSDV